ncbi:hypothetical protein G6F40_014606 [Rhizopus arrhizus]|nr:hypothetical protein G6F40_014606 [Rhizopus arrhizus]
MRARGIQPGQALVGGQPQQSVIGQRGGGDRPALQGNAWHAVYRIEQARRHLYSGAQGAAQLVAPQPHQAPAAIEPQMPACVGDHAGDALEHTGHVSADGHEWAISHARGKAGFAGHQQQLLMLQQRGHRPHGKPLGGIEGVDARAAHAAQPAACSGKRASRCHWPCW